MTDAQVADERFLVLINNLLASGEIPDLFSDDEVENIVTMVRNEVKGAGLQDTRENCWKFFIDRVRRQLKVRQYWMIEVINSDILVDHATHAKGIRIKCCPRPEG